MLGRRDIDRSTNWCVDYQCKEDTIATINFIFEIKKHQCLMYDDILECIDFSTLRGKQQKDIDIIIIHYHSNQMENPLCMIIQGTMGIRKYYLISAISQSLCMVAMPNPSPLLLLAPTTVATFNIGALRIHSNLEIPIKHFT